MSVLLSAGVSSLVPQTPAAHTAKIRTAWAWLRGVVWPPGRRAAWVLRIPARLQSRPPETRVLQRAPQRCVLPWGHLFYLISHREGFHKQALLPLTVQLQNVM